MNRPSFEPGAVIRIQRLRGSFRVVAVADGVVTAYGGSPTRAPLMRSVAAERCRPEKKTKVS